MRNHVYYREQAAGCRRLAAAEPDQGLAGEIERLARRYELLAGLWPVELLVEAG